ncbi:HK97 family phage prohead protease [Sporosarcina newyorkensis]|uniref:Prohead serine protease domain-containing protein n=1 Tax=Sporosarcina newyorkensis TaxID=759851 RepID=A0A1T4YTK7_9BACL|nr:HK97 family phage prohead protease [Sporosarcina newyorkensis]SKB05129.1 prohead peptidase. Unknown type peptidase. MEROPS family U35 [Sporosarcina newyorkensis]
MKIERRNYPITDMEVRSEEGKPTTLRGYAAVFDQLSVPLYGFREKIQKGAFAESLSKNNIKALWNHNSDFPLGSTNGSTLRLEEDERGLLFELDLPDNSWGRDAGVAIQRKDVDGVSFGFSVKKDSWDNTNPEQSIRTLVDVELIEISPTPFPAYPSTNVSARSVTEAIQDVDFKEILRSAIKDVMQEERQAPPNEPTPSYSIDILMRRLELEENY